jgi:hypothetical protein
MTLNPVHFLFYFMGERRELNPCMVDSQSTTLVHLTTSILEKQTNCLYLQSFLLGRNDNANVCMWVGDLLQGIKARSMTNSQPTIEQVFIKYFIFIPETYPDPILPQFFHPLSIHPWTIMIVSSLPVRLSFCSKKMQFCILVR